MKKETIPAVFCRLCGKYREEILIRQHFGPFEIEACSACRVTMHNLDLLLTAFAARQKAIMAEEALKQSMGENIFGPEPAPPVPPIDLDAIKSTENN